MHHARTALYRLMFYLEYPRSYGKSNQRMVSAMLRRRFLVPQENPPAHLHIPLIDTQLHSIQDFMLEGAIRHLVNLPVMLQPARAVVVQSVLVAEDSDEEAKKEAIRALIAALQAQLINW